MTEKTEVEFYVVVGIKAHGAEMDLTTKVVDDDEDTALERFEEDCSKGEPRIVYKVRLAVPTAPRFVEVAADLPETPGGSYSLEIKSE